MTDYSKLSQEMQDKLAAIESRSPLNKQVEATQNLTGVTRLVLDAVTQLSRETLDDTSQTLEALQSLSDNLTDGLKALDKDAPEIPDYASPVVNAVDKLQKSIEKAVKGIDVKPQVNVESPSVNVDAPKIDLKGIERILKVDIPKAFAEAIKLVPKTEVPETDLNPVTELLSELSEKLESIDTAVRMKPSGNVKVINASEIGGGGLTDAELRATPVKTDDNETQTKLDAVIALSDKPSTATLSNVTMTGASVTLATSSASRKSLFIFNDSGVVVYVKLDSTASSTSFTIKMADQGYYELPSPIYTGIVTALGASGVVRVTVT